MNGTSELEARSSLAILEPNPVAAEAQRILDQSGYGDLRQLRCEYHDGSLSIRGRLRSYFLKQMAQTLVSRLEGVRRVVNQIQVTA